VLALKHPTQELYNPTMDSPQPDQDAPFEVEHVMEYCYKLKTGKHDKFFVFGNLDVEMDQADIQPLNDGLVSLFFPTSLTDIFRCT
jgi:hypothetical protein